MSMIIAERDTNIIIRTKNDVYEHRPNDSYNKLKYGTFQANRIFHTWDSEARVEETFNERIFNCYYRATDNDKEELLQLRKANDICQAILDKDKEAFVYIFKKNFYDLHKAQLVEGLIDNDILLKGRVKRTKQDEFIVDEAFKVDGHANTYVLEIMHKSKNVKPRWRNLCTVIKLKNSPRKVMTKTIGEVEIDSKTLDCISKIYSLVQPHTWDQTIWNQMPTWLKRIYKDELKAFTKRKELK